MEGRGPRNEPADPIALRMNNGHGNALTDDLNSERALSPKPCGQGQTLKSVLRMVNGLS